MESKSQTEMKVIEIIEDYVSYLFKDINLFEIISSTEEESEEWETLRHLIWDYVEKQEINKSFIKELIKLNKTKFEELKKLRKPITITKWFKKERGSITKFLNNKEENRTLLEFAYEEADQLLFEEEADEYTKTQLIKELLKMYMFSYFENLKPILIKILDRVEPK